MDLEYKNNALHWLIFSGIAAYFFLINVDLAVVNLALPTIGQQLHASANILQWMLNAFFLVVSCAFVFGGKVADFFGAKRTFLAGIFLFLVSSLICGAAQQGWEVVLGRGVQGLALATTFTCGMLLVQSIFPENQRGRAIGYVMGVVGFAQAVGPSFGGLLIHYFSWRWIFFINIPFSLYSLMIVSLFIENKPGHLDWSFDALGNILWCVAILFISLGLTISHSNQVYSVEQIVLIFLGLFILGAFLFCEKKVKNPLIHLELLSNKNYLFLLIIRIAAQLTFFTYLFILSLYLQNILGYSVLHASYILLFVSLAQAVSGLTMGKFTDIYGYRITSIIAMSGMAASSVLAFLFSTQSIFILIILSMLMSFSVGMVFTCGMVGVTKNISAKDKGVATGLYYSVTFTFSTFGIAGFSFITSVLGERFVLTNTVLNQAVMPIVKKAIMGGLSLKQYATNFVVYPQLVTNIIGQFQYGMKIMLLIFLMLSILGLISAIKLKE